MILKYVTKSLVILLLKKIFMKIYKKKQKTTEPPELPSIA